MSAKIGLGSPNIERVTSKQITELAAFATASFMDTFAYLYTAENLDLFLKQSRSKEYYAKEISNPANHIWIIRDKDMSGAPIIGYAKVGPNSLPVTSPKNNALELAQLYIDKTHQGKGLGQTLLSHAIDIARQHSYLEVILGVYFKNIGAQKLYERNGFSKIAEYDFPVGTHIDREFIMLKTL